MGQGEIISCSKDNVINLLSEVGFSGAHIEEKKGKQFISYCAVATKE